MNPFLRVLRDWFGFTRRERRSSFILLIIICIVAGLKYLVPERRLELEEISLEPVIVNNVTYSGNFISQDNVRDEKQEIRKRDKIVPGRIIRIELNTCDSATLVALPGIGPVLSVRIIKYRNLIGGYVRVDQLREVYGLPEETFNLISSKLTADPAIIRKISINTADYSILARHPYFKKNEVSAILKYRELKGSIESIDEMLRNNLISEETAGKLRDYLEF